MQDSDAKRVDLNIECRIQMQSEWIKYKMQDSNAKRVDLKINVGLKM